ncbi:MAG: WG repeat-containing protein [Chitinophagales bacterium]|nr:WG repeat-containing protein [Chitinophagales bacterium]
MKFYLIIFIILNFFLPFTGFNQKRDSLAQTRVPMGITFNNRMLYKVGNKYGFKNKEGIIIVKADYDNAYNFEFGRAIVKQQSKWAVIDTNGKNITAFKYDHIGKFSSLKIADVANGRHSGLINVNGVEVVEVKYDYINGPTTSYIPKPSIADNSHGDILKNNYLTFIYINTKLNGKYGILDTTGKIIVPFIYDEYIYFEESIAIVKKDNLMGIIDTTGKVILPINYHSISIKSNNIWILQKEQTGTKAIYDNFTGVSSPEFQDYRKINYKYYMIGINKKFRLYNIITNQQTKEQYDDIREIENEYFRVENDKKYGILNNQFKIILPVGYDKIQSFYFNAFKVERNNLTGIIDTSNKTIIPIKFKSLSKVDNFYVALDNKYGIIDLKNNIILPFKYDSLILFRNSTVLAKLNNKFGILGFKNEILVPIVYEEVYQLGIFCIFRKANKYNVFNISNKIMLGPFNSYIIDLDANILVNENDTWRYLNPDQKLKESIIAKEKDKLFFIDGNGKLIKKITGSYYDRVGDKLFVLKIDDKYSLVDNRGKQLTKRLYDDYTQFRHGFAAVKFGQKFGYINKTGQEVTSFIYDEADQFYLGKARVRIGQKTFIIDSGGEVVEE